MIQDSTLNVRALEIDPSGYALFALSNGKIGGTLKNGTNEIARLTVQLKKDTIIPNFRSLAVTSKAGFVLSIASPALLYKISRDSLNVVYQEAHPDAFYDAMEFWNDEEGIAIGDSVEGCLSVIITRDGGNTWTKLSCDELPKGIDGEGAFAASDTNIAIQGDNTWVATTAGRIYYSEDKGVSWETITTPIVKDKDTEGIYSLDFI